MSTPLKHLLHKLVAEIREQHTELDRQQRQVKVSARSEGLSTQEGATYTEYRHVPKRKGAKDAEFVKCEIRPIASKERQTRVHRE